MTNEPIEPVDAKPGLRAFNKAALWTVEIITDGLTGDIKVLTPITVGGARDTERRKRYISEVVVTFNGHPFPVKFEIMAGNLEEACDRFVEQGIAAGERFTEELQQQQLRAKLTGAGAAPFVGFNPQMRRPPN